MKTIPQVREELVDIAGTLVSGDNTDPATIAAGRKIRRLVREMYRRPYVRKAKTESNPVTNQMRQDIKRMARENPSLSYMSMAKVFKVATGRISEVLAGKRAA